jgi:hypothetical protein
MPNAPYTNPPTDPKVKDAADGIYFGWMGLAQDAIFRANMSLIIKDGMVAALTDPTVIAAHTLAIKNALCDPAVVDCLAEAIADGGEDAIVNAVNALVTAGTIPTRADWGRAFALLALACASERKAYFMKATSAADYADLKSRVTATEVNVLD